MRFTFGIALAQSDSVIPKSEEIVWHDVLYLSLCKIFGMENAGNGVQWHVA